MLTVNEYFGGNIKSIGLVNSSGKSTVGVMDIGDYEFGTSTIEYMTVVSGALTVMLPGASEWQLFSAGETFLWLLTPNSSYRWQSKRLICAGTNRTNTQAKAILNP